MDFTRRTTTLNELIGQAVKAMPTGPKRDLYERNLLRQEYHSEVVVYLAVNLWKLFRDVDMIMLFNSEDFRGDTPLSFAESDVHTYVDFITETLLGISPLAFEPDVDDGLGRSCN